MALPGFLYRNLAAGLTPASGSSTAASGFPWSNLDNPQPRKRARVSATTAILIFDLGSAQAVDTWFLGSTSLPITADVRIFASTTDPLAQSALDLNTTYIGAPVTDPEYNGQVVFCFTETTSRYWRLEIISAINPIDIGISKLGLLFRPENGLEYGFQEGRIDLSVRDLNEDTGAEFAVSGPKKRIVQFVMGGTESEVRGLTTSFSDMDRIVGASGDVVFVEDSDAVALTRARDAVYGPYREIGASLATRQASTFWTRIFQMRERL